MNHMGRLAKKVGVAAVLLWAGAASASVIYDNGAGTPTSVLLSDVDPLPAVQFLADDFTLQLGAASVTDIHWTGAYAFSDTPGPTDDFTIQVFADSAGLPVLSPFATFNVGNAVNRIDTATSVSGFEVFSYSSVIPALNLSPGTRYWLSIFNDTAADADDDWFWAANQTVGTLARRSHPGDAWIGVSGTLDFQLTNDGAPVPEPATVALLGVALAALTFARRARQPQAFNSANISRQHRSSDSSPSSCDPPFAHRRRARF